VRFKESDRLAAMAEELEKTGSGRDRIRGQPGCKRHRQAGRAGTYPRTTTTG
jgi:5-enolpyruvylshikimate-3-phosphate synthase